MTRPLHRAAHQLATAVLVAALGTTLAVSQPAAAAQSVAPSGGSPTVSAAAVTSPDVTSPVGTSDPSPAGTYIVRAEPGRLDDVTRAVRDRGLRVSRQIEIIEAVVVDLPPGGADALRSHPLVISVTADAPVTLASSGYDPDADIGSLFTTQTLTGVREAWRSKSTGAGVDVALIDSGVSPVVGLAEPGALVNGPDLTPESQNAATRYLDTNGHGTHLAGIIAGRDPGADPQADRLNPDVFLGVAPGARIVSVKVADARGNSDVSQVIAGIGWVVQHAKDPGMNIRVLNLAFGTNSTQAYTLDPLAFAVEVAWRRGIVVVTSAGNSGFADGRLTTPANDPYVIAVGADDLNKTRSTNDDVIPDFSSRGDGVRNPDLVAPGAHIQSLRVPGSYIDTESGGSGRIDERFFRGSGTSQATAFVSGAVALLLQVAPSLNPDQVKLYLRSKARPLPGADPQAQGSGLLDVRKLTPSGASGKQSWTRSTGTGTLDASRGDARLILNGVVLSGEKDFKGRPFSASAMADAASKAKSWTGGTWNGSSWAGSTWAGSSWAPTTWTGSSWAGSSWAFSSWASGTWDGSSWSAPSWDGSDWAGSSWSGKSWSGKSWAGKAWADSSWS